MDKKRYRKAAPKASSPAKASVKKAFRPDPARYVISELPVKGHQFALIGVGTPDILVNDIDSVYSRVTVKGLVHNTVKGFTDRGDAVVIRMLDHDTIPFEKKILEVVLG